MGRAVLVLVVAIALESCAPDIAPVSVAECEMREHIASVRYLRSETTKRGRAHTAAAAAVAKRGGGY